MKQVERESLPPLSLAGFELGEILGVEPDDEQIAGELGISTARVRQYRTAAVAPISLDSLLGEDSDNHISDVIADEDVRGVACRRVELRPRTPASSLCPTSRVLGSRTRSRI